jgi:hypothetical protein
VHYFFSFGQACMAFTRRSVVSGIKMSMETDSRSPTANSPMETCLGIFSPYVDGYRENLFGMR